MIPEKIKALFQLIDFLYDNMDSFKSYHDTIRKMDKLKRKRSQLAPNLSYQHKIEDDELREQLKSEIEIYNQGIINPIKNKVAELQICEWNDPVSFYNNNIKAIYTIIRNFELNDVQEIKKYESKYLEFRKSTHKYLSLPFFIDSDDVLIILFEYFTDRSNNEYETAGIINKKNKVHCTPTSFKHDISELCNDCYLIDGIKNGIKNKIEREAKEQQEILTPEQFKQYLNNEIKSAQNAMKEAKSAEENTGPNDYYRHNRIELYIWNKERIKKLNEFLENELNKALPHQQNENVLNNETENDVTLSTIEDWLFEFKNKGVLKGANYNTLVSALYDYLKTGQFPIIENEIKVGRVNKKLFGWNLNRILHHEGKGVETDLLLFAKNNISIFKYVEFDLCDIKKSNLYKYFTTQTK